MRVCVIGKFPPIQGGVSTRTYWIAHGLAARGHEVHVVTNAKDAASPFRMHMRAPDWQRCEATYRDGSVTVHWSDPVDRSQSYVPMANPFISKLAGTAARVHSERPFDVIFSFYMEPYGIAGHLAAEMTGAPHVVRMAGSDAGRLWRHPQFEALYDHVLRSAQIVVAGGAVAERAIQRGVDPDRIALGGGLMLPEDLFTPDGPVLDLAQLRIEIEGDPDLRDSLWGGFAGDRPYFGIYGKLGDRKGTFALLAAMSRLRGAGVEVGLVALAHGPPDVEERFRARANELGLADRILQIPFLPHWRVPEFLRGCLAVCCLEQDFPIAIHNPIIAREVLLCGACLIGSVELITKLPAYERLPHGYGCVAVEDVNDIDALSNQLAAIVRDPEPLTAVRQRGRHFAREVQPEVSLQQRLERLLEAAAARRQARSAPRRSAVTSTDAGETRFALTRLAADAIAERNDGRSEIEEPTGTRGFDLAQARKILARVKQLLDQGHADLQPLVPAIEIEIAIAAAEQEAEASKPPIDYDPLFRARARRWAVTRDDIAEMVPLRDRLLRVVALDCDAAQFMGVRTMADLPADPAPGRSHIAVFGRSARGQRGPLLIDEMTAQILALCNGTLTAREIAGKLPGEICAATTQARLEWIESLFVRGLISLQDQR